MKLKNLIISPFCVLNSDWEKIYIFHITNAELKDVFCEIYPLEYLYKISNTTDRHYKNITIKKKNGEPRYIKAPDIELLFLQRIILDNILNNIPVSDCAKAYRKGVHITENAMPHINKTKILKLDIKDFFGSITLEMVYSYVFNSNYFSKSAGMLLTNLCCIDGCLPQGAPTSPAISNIVMKNFDYYISNWCKERKINYTRYCDDMTFSGDFDEKLVINKVSGFLNKMGFEINTNKTKLIPYYRKQMITGIVVNDKLSISREYKRQIRQEIYYCKKFGIESHIRHTNNSQYIKKDKVLIGQYINHLYGKISFLLQVQPGDEEVLEYRDYLYNLNLKQRNNLKH